MKKLKNLVVFKNKKISLNSIKKILIDQGFTIKKKKSNFFLKDLKSFYLTAISSFGLIIIFTLIPLSVNIKEDIKVSKSTIDNTSNVDFQKVLDGKSINQKNVDEGLDLENLFEDIFSIEEVPTDTVRLSANTINQLFKDTKYNLENVRKNKIVKPINLSLLPSEIRNIESTKKKKNLFIKIVLPLILEENNRIKFDRKKLFKILNKNKNSDAEKRWLNSKFKQYGVLNKDLSTLKVRMDIVPVSLAIAQAAKESGWGTSRFAKEFNALFGEYTYDFSNGVVPLSREEGETHLVKSFDSVNKSVQSYFNNLNSHYAYKDFREVRKIMREKNNFSNLKLLIKELDSYAADINYIKTINSIIDANKFHQFDAFSYSINNS